MELLPIDLVCIKDYWLVHMIDPARLDLNRGFLKQSLPDDTPVDEIIPLDRWFNLNRNKHGDIVPTRTSGIFHVARCGSTLLTQNLKATGQFMALGEPKFIGRLLSRYAGSVEPALLCETLQLMVHVWENWASTQGKRLVIKFSSLGKPAVARALQCLPRSNFVFLYREPTGVLESLTRKPPSYVRRANARPHGDEIPGLVNRPDAGHAVNATRSYCSIIDGFSEITDPRIMPVDYNDLARQFGTIVTHFDPAFPADNLIWDDRIYAKWQGDEPHEYAAIGAAQMAAFSERESELIEIANGYYEKFRKSRSAGAVIG